MNTQTKAEAAAEPSVVTKITVKTAGVDPSKVKAQAGSEPLHLMRVYGIATGTKEKEDARGESITAILGNFEALNPETGEVSRSGVMYLPGGIHEMISGALGSEENAKIEFALDIFSVKATNRIGYSYTCKQIFKSEAKDELSELRTRVHDKAKALPAPKNSEDKKK